VPYLFASVSPSYFIFIFIFRGSPVHH